MAIDGFAGGLGDGSGGGVLGGDEEFGIEFLEGGEGEEVFFVEVGGDDEEAAGVEALEGVVEELGPELGAVPEVLVAEEGEVGGVGELAEEGEF